MAATIVTIAASPAAARAAEDDGRARIRYEAPIGCPSYDELVDGVRARTPRLRLDDSATRVFEVQVSGADGGFRGTLRVGASSRAVEAEACEKVVGALAFVIALTIDPAARPAAPPASTPDPPEPPASASTRPEAPPPAPVAGDAPPAPEKNARAGAGDRRAILRASASLELVGAAAPSMLMGGAIGIGLEPRASVWLPEARLSIVAVDSRPLAGAAAPARFWMFGGRLEGCAPRINLPASVSAASCVGVEAAVLDATGLDVANPSSTTRPWVDVRAGVRLRWPARGRLAAEVAGGALFPLTRDSFVFHDPRIVVHEVPTVAPFGTLGASLSF